MIKRNRANGQHIRNTYLCDNYYQLSEQHLQKEEETAATETTCPSTSIMMNILRLKLQFLKTQRKEEYDVLRELEDFFKVGEESTRQQIPVPVPPEQPKIPNMEEHVRTDSWHAKTESEHYVNEWERKKSEVKKIISSVDSSIEKKAALFEASLDKKDATFSSIALAVKSKMKNPSTLKEYIIFSEILGKPKALRR